MILPLAEEAGVPTVAVIGNPNAGKSTVFNRLTGLSQRVGNYPGVTVEKKEGRWNCDGTAVRLLDLPGVYSLAARSPDEMVAVDVLLGHQEAEARPDLVIEIADASNLERNLYLLSQVLELGIPVILALSMVDVAAARGIEVDVGRLSERLGVPVVAVDGRRGKGLADLEAAVHRALASPRQDGETAAGPPTATGDWEELRSEVGEACADLSPAFRAARGRDLHPFEILRAAIDRGGHAEERLCRALGSAPAGERLDRVRALAGGRDSLPALEAALRYRWVRERLDGCLRRRREPSVTWSERMDRILTHKVLGLLIFAALMLLVFQSIFTWAAPLMSLVESGFTALSSFAGDLLPAGVLRSLVTDGIIAGAGMVVLFLPQILILFLFIGLLEDCGYMARAAFIMDRVMHKCGLSGKSFIPMLSGFACAIPGIMAARVIEDRKDRLATVLVTPLMSCSARLPVYTILIGSFIPDTPLPGGLLGLQGLTLFSLYALGILTAVAMAWVFRSTLLRGEPSPFVLELPSYKWPTLSGVLLRLLDRGKAFLVRAGTTILAIAVIVWALAYFPRPAAIAERFAGERAALAAQALAAEERAAALAHLDEREAGEYLRQSYFGRLGHAVEPAFTPLGWDWRIAMAAIASFPAREVVVATLGTIYNLGTEVDEGSAALRSSLREATWQSGPRQGEPVFSVPVALSIMVFFALCCQCGATVATIRRETNSWGWAWFAFGYMTVLAYVGAFLTYQLGGRLAA
jgi:ferrous iron transport protein B